MDGRLILGADGERIATSHLERSGYSILARNWRTGSGGIRGELDVVARHGSTLVFVEVKTRTSDRFGGPLLAVTARKQAKLRALAGSFLRETGTRARDLRFDVIAIDVRAGEDPRIDHRVAAF